MATKYNLEKYVLEYVLSSKDWVSVYDVYSHLELLPDIGDDELYFGHILYIWNKIKLRGFDNYFNFVKNNKTVYIKSTLDCDKDNIKDCYNGNYTKHNIINNDDSFEDIEEDDDYNVDIEEVLMDVVDYPDLYSEYLEDFLLDLVDETDIKFIDVLLSNKLNINKDVIINFIRTINNTKQISLETENPILKEYIQIINENNDSIKDKMMNNIIVQSANKLDITYQFGIIIFFILFSIIYCYNFYYTRCNNKIDSILEIIKTNKL